jgi:hypothetical protein
MESGMTYPPALIATGLLKGVTSPCEAQFGHRGQRIANSIRSISFLSIRPWCLAISAYGGKRRAEVQSTAQFHANL